MTNFVLLDPKAPGEHLLISYIRAFIKLCYTNHCCLEMAAPVMYAVRKQENIVSLTYNKIPSSVVIFWWVRYGGLITRRYMTSK